MTTSNRPSKFLVQRPKIKEAGARAKATLDRSRGPAVDE
jgi:hypothetical protein